MRVALLLCAFSEIAVLGLPRSPGFPGGRTPAEGVPIEVRRAETAHGAAAPPVVSIPERRKPTAW